MRRYLNIVASFILMLCIGSVYAWSIIASELVQNSKFSVFQTQLIFGILIAIFPITMIFVGNLAGSIKHRYLGYISGVLFFFGYLISGISSGNFWAIMFGIGIIGGLATGFGYWVALTSPIQWFPNRKGLITGIAAAGFGLGAVFMSKIAEVILLKYNNVFFLLRIIGIAYGLIIVLVSNFIFHNTAGSHNHSQSVGFKSLLRERNFVKLFIGIFLGTFAGLLIIGNLKLIGSLSSIPNHHLIVGISTFALANFTGRIFWGYLSDRIGAGLSIFMSLTIQSLAIASLTLLKLDSTVFLILSALIGFGFGGNFVLFAKETAQVYGLQLLGKVYPYVFIGYAIAGIFGPITGGYLFDLTGTYLYGILLSALLSLTGGVIFIVAPVESKANR